MKTKKCSKCGEIKSVSEFYKSKSTKDGLGYRCKKCSLDGIKKWQKDNPEREAIRNANWQKNNPEKVRAKYRRWKARDPERAKKLYRKYKAKRMKKISNRISDSISLRILQFIKRGKGCKHWEDLLNYTAEDLKQHLESQFKSKMTWNNYGEWHIDHIIPVSFFDFKSYKDTEFKLCWCLGNLQPLWAKENSSKNGKLIDKYIKDIRLTNEV